jgi:protein phosphatase PTC7
MILRQRDERYYLEYKSEEQSHSFNMPYQVGSTGDNPDKAKTNKHQVEAKDIIILATDGLWDNLTTENIINIVNDTKSDLNVLASELATKAENMSYMKYISLIVEVITHPLRKRPLRINTYIWEVSLMILQ